LISPPKSRGKRKNEIGISSAAQVHVPRHRLGVEGRQVSRGGFDVEKATAVMDKLLCWSRGRESEGLRPPRYGRPKQREAGIPGGFPGSASAIPRPSCYWTKLGNLRRIYREIGR